MFNQTFTYKGMQVAASVSGRIVAEWIDGGWTPEDAVISRAAEILDLAEKCHEEQYRALISLLKGGPIHVLDAHSCNDPSGWYYWTGRGEIRGVEDAIARAREGVMIVSVCNPHHARLQKAPPVPVMYPTTFCYGLPTNAWQNTYDIAIPGKVQ